jgi:hypothetical protein
LDCRWQRRDWEHVADAGTGCKRKYVDEPNPWKLVKANQELKADNDHLVTRISAEDDALEAQ